MRKFENFECLVYGCTIDPRFPGACSRCYLSPVEESFIVIPKYVDIIERISSCKYIGCQSVHKADLEITLDIECYKCMRCESFADSKFWIRRRHFDVGQILFRAVTHAYETSDSTRIKFIELQVKKVTPRGCWVVFNKKRRFIPVGSFFADSNKISAVSSLKKRTLSWYFQTLTAIKKSSHRCMDLSIEPSPTYKFFSFPSYSREILTDENNNYKKILQVAPGMLIGAIQTVELQNQLNLDFRFDVMAVKAGDSLIANEFHIVLTAGKQASNRDLRSKEIGKIQGSIQVLNLFS